MILSYIEYSEMGGCLDEAVFCRLEQFAEEEIDCRTCGRLSDTKGITDKIKRLIFALIPILECVYSVHPEGVVSSVSNDGVSVSYSAKAADELEAVLAQQIESALLFEKSDKGEPMLYCGVNPCG